MRDNVSGKNVPKAIGYLVELRILSLLAGLKGLGSQGC